MSVECKACGAQVPADAKTCPGCGAAVVAKTKLVPLAAFMLIVILIIQSYMSKSEDAASEAKPAAPVNSAEQ
ncbi:zinc-ribbon domain-containing protein [Pseudomonas sp. OTU750018]|uniref:zinc-ribbon domain-containing protein n=1 Tax=Pseudomonas sp. OTU750018 TaxID=2709708 RepID=UPI0014230937|nr:zinc ribbon domain-containing protein [Pseudomonas sp. OTU750018]